MHRGPQQRPAPVNKSYCENGQMESGPSPVQRRRKGDDPPTFIEAARREQITSLAIDLIAEHGYSGTSLAGIAEAAGISKAAVLYHFGSKDAVLEAAYARVMSGVTDSVGAAMSNSPSAADSVEAYVRSLVDYIVANPTHMRIVVEVLQTDELGQRGAAPDAADAPPRWGPLADAMTRAQRTGEFRRFDSRTYAIVLGSAIDGVFAESLADPAFDLGSAVDDVIDLFRRASAP